jgi:hypothetical protein
LGGATLKKLIPLILLMMILAAGCDLTGISITTAAPVVNSFNASPSSITAGKSSNLSWNVTGATNVSIDQGIGNVALAGNRDVMPVTTTVYTLTATNKTSVSVLATTQVVVTGTATPPTPPSTSTTGSLPVVNYFSASPSTIYAGDSAILSWSVSNATSISIDHGVGAVGLSGSVSVSPATSTDYILTATNASGYWIKGTTVLVSGVPSTPSFSVTGVIASVNPPSFTGACPTTFYSEAIIAVNGPGPGTVTYRWERSDGGYESTQSVNFTNERSQTVSRWWNVDTSGTYWVRVHILSPNDTTSNQANFTLNCASAPTDGWTGTWSTTYGMMYLTQTGNQVTGTYEHSNGHIVGTVSGNVLTGTWSEAPTYSPPDNAGDVQLTISSDGKTFTGGWRYGSSGSWTMNWTGTTIF